MISFRKYKRHIKNHKRASGIIGAIVIIGILVGIVSAASHYSVPTNSVSITKPHPHKTKTTNSPPVNLPALTVPPVTVTTPTPVTTPNNTAQCNSILAAGEADLNSLNAQVNQQLAIMKQVMGTQSSGLGGEIGGSGTQGMVDQSGQSESFNQADNEATTLSNQLSTDRQNYVNQLLGLSCGTQSEAMLNYNPSTQ